MQLKSFLIVVKDNKRASKFYEDLFGLKVVKDYDGNMLLSGGITLQEEKYWKKFLGRDITAKSNSCELYFEEKDIAGFIEKLKKLYPDTEFVNKLTTHEWGQTVVRFYDLDGNLIEVGTPFNG